ncbi:MAG: glycosyltransferase family 2 protein, partial [Bacteroidales bacterium]|nr:glycosyltransferase family 2 protein [Bacteroidales bacterium]
INRAMQFTDTPVVIFSDANAMLNPQAVREIVSLFEDPHTGCVAGEKRIHRVETGKLSTKGEGLYWRYESFLKRMDSRLYTTVGAAGELYAIRRELFEELGETVLLDDFMLSMKIASKGYRISYCPAAYAVEGGSHNLGEERKRKVRIAAGGVQSVIRLWRLLNIFHYPVLSFQYISHRVLRWTVTPVALFLLFPLNLYILFQERSLIYLLLMLFQVFFYTMGIAGILLEKRGPVSKVMTIPGYFLFMNINVIRGFFYLCRRKKEGTGTWEKVKRA